MLSTFFTEHGNDSVSTVHTGREHWAGKACPVHSGTCSQDQSGGNGHVVDSGNVIMGQVSFSVIEDL